MLQALMLQSEFPEVLTGILPQKPMETECMDIFLNDCIDVKLKLIINARLSKPLHHQDKANAHDWKLVNESIITKVYLGHKGNLKIFEKKGN